MSLELNKFNDYSKWDEFLDQSSQSNVFCASWLLKLRNKSYDFYFVSEKKKILATVMVALDDGLPTNKPWIYHGIFFNNTIETNQHHSTSRKKIEITNFIIHELIKIYGSVSFSLHPSILDLRAFQWYNFDDQINGKFILNINYTSILDLTLYSGFDDYLKNIRSVRRQEYNKCIRDGFQIEISTNIKLLDQLHEKTFKRQGLERNDHDKMLCNQVARHAVENNLGQMIICKNKSGEPMSAGLFLFHKQCSYYLIGATDQEFRKNSPMTFIILEHIKNLSKLGINKMDFCGINSPNRGDYKLSYNGNITQFFDVSFQNNKTFFGK